MKPDIAARASALVYGEDLEVGRTYRLGAHTITEDELIDFASNWDPQRFHVDKDAAEAGAYGGLIASGLHTLSVYQKLVVDTVFSDWHVIAGRSLREVRFLRPVRPGDTLTGTVHIRNVVLDEVRNRALTTLEAELTGHHGRPVLTATVDAYIHTRSHTR
ncbi:MaoC/PaaZ C-terminal domain-containing protein [Rhodococcus aetherivorans]|uniref:MaoC/PaaZ C-terminal domain-containing protein n=1 Tax=Rhodococcus TaxID=1827 RepID=UPI0002D23641|nr:MULTISPECIES: MaoC/PaaZ C-terminal domain-containing protein [Rhodococcus]WKW98912.1 MaoC/PaaZ C-terminal domain-containing protein [Rhodococcus aetherivorans]CCW11998.1 hypothetical protein EBESD8_25440 [Rhodococcus aetherivorans]